MLDYDDKMVIMDRLYRDYTANPLKYTCIYKAIPVELIDEYKKFIDFTRFYIMYRGPRRGNGNCTLKKDAIKADIYQYSSRDILINRQDRENYLKYCNNIT